MVNEDKPADVELTLEASRGKDAATTFFKDGSKRKIDFVLVFEEEKAEFEDRPFTFPPENGEGGEAGATSGGQTK